ncbi:MAG: hypothetical protein M5U09_21165 [Gammaproteobacteria bacterium]|nr:hypothetical protein [Gammaproteobacteria bacterium]
MFASFIAPLAAAFAGAWAAFKLQESHEDRKERQTRESAIKRGIFVLTQQWNHLCTIQRKLNQFRDDPLRYLNLPPLRANKLDEIRINIESLDFILGTEHSQELMELSLDQSHYDQTVMAIAIRADFMTDDLFPAFEKASVKFLQAGDGDVELNMSDRVLRMAKSYTDNMYEHVDTTTERLNGAIRKLFRVGKELYPDAKFILPVASDDERSFDSYP